MNAQTQVGRYGRKEAAPAVPAPNQNETQEQFLARCKTLKIADADAQAAWTKAHPVQSEGTFTAKELNDAVTAAVREGLKALPTPLGEDAIKKIVSDVLAGQKADSQKLDVESLTASLAAAVSKAADASGRKAQKQVLHSDDARGQIEIPYAWCKGNLPLHGKQLLNILTHPGQPAETVINVGIEQSDIDRGIKLGEGIINKYRQAVGRKTILTSTGSGTGDEFVPSDLSAELQRRLYLASDLAAVLSAREVDMPTNPYIYPLLTTRPSWHLEATEGTATAVSTPGSAQITLTASKIMGAVSFSYELDEDSIIPILPQIQSVLSETAASTYESCLINGDTTATHQDSDTQTDAKAPERAFKGFRKLALAGSVSASWASGSINEANARALIKLMGIYGLRLEDLIWIVGPKGKNDMAAITNVATVDKYGQGATILTGQLNSFLGIPIIASAACREDLNASGVYDGTTTTKGSVILANVTRFLPGRRRAFTLESMRDIYKQQTDLVASFRRAFVPIETPSTTIPSVAIGYNYTA